MKISYKRAIKTIVLFFAISVCYPQSSRFGKLSFNKAVNISGKQRMLTQKMAKNYLYLFKNPNDIKAKNELKISKIIFEKQNLILKNNTSSQITNSRIKQVEVIWAKYKKFLESTPNKEDAAKIINTNSTILKEANNLVNAILLESKGSTNTDDTFIEEEDAELKKIINKSGRQRMLSQRLALYYFANTPSFKTPNTQNKLQNVFSEIDGSLNDLLISSFNNDRIEESLGKVMSLWEDVKLNQNRLFKQGYSDEEIYKLSNELTKGFNRVTVLYEKIKVE